MEVVHHNPPRYTIGEMAKVAVRFPIGHYRVLVYLRGKQVEVTRILGRYVNPEEEAFGRNAGSKLWCYLISIPQIELWPDYAGKPDDRLEVEVFENWLEHLKLTANE